MDIVFENYTKDVIKAIEKLGIQWLEEASGEVEAQVKRNTVVDTGKTKGSWEHKVDEQKQEAYIGSNYENAIWEEFGTGIYAVKGNGRKTPWTYKDEKGNWHKTRGKKPRRALQNAFNQKESEIINIAKQTFKELK